MVPETMDRNGRRIGRLAVCGAGVVLSVALAGCGAPNAAAPGGSAEANSVLEQIGSLPADQQREKATELAKSEGSLTLYTEVADDVSHAMAQAFQDKYGITVNVYRASAETVEQRVQQESSAGRLGGDVLVLGDGEITDVANEPGVLQNYTGPGVEDLGDAAVFDGWSAVSGYLYVPVWSTDRISSGQEPTSWEDLADPRFDGKMVIEESDSNWYGALTEYWLEQGKSQGDIDALWQKIVDGSVVGSGHSAIMQLLAAGSEGIAAMNYDYIAAGQIDKGAPLSFASEDGSIGVHAFIYPVGVGLFSQAKNPAAAWLFADWLMGDGQKFLTDAHLLSAHQVAGDEAIKGVETSIIPKDVIADGTKWAEAFDSLLRKAPKAPEK